MSEPSLKIIGVYRPRITADMWQEQFGVLDDSQLNAEHKEHFQKLVLIEGIASGLVEPLDMGKFGQMATEHPDDPRYMQVGYDEGLLSGDGETLIQRDMDCIEGSGPLRFAVYLHYYDPQRPLLWQNGEIQCPPIQDVPVRLMMLMPYNACT